MPSLGKYLQPLGIGNLGNMKDYAHASRLYLDSAYALAPKAGWLYYVVFDIDPSAITDSSWANQQRVSEVGMLVKSVDLPKFNVQTEVVNQYNKKTVVQKNIVYTPVSFDMHDDQSNVVHNMWVNYYRYYFADSQQGPSGPIGTAQTNSTGAFQKGTQYNPPNGLFNPTNFGLNSQLVVAPFFRSVTIYQLNRKVFTSFQLVNPIIQSWEHDKMDQSQGAKTSESRMQLQYEGVFYGAGRVSKDTPTGFATFHYDTSPSPLSLAGGGNSSLFGPGGVVQGGLELFGDVSGTTNPGAKTNPLSSIIKAGNLARNVKGVNLDSIKAEGYSILNNALRKAGQGGLNGLGVNLNLNKGSNYATAGEFLGTPVSVITAAAVGQDFGPTPINSPVSSALISSDPSAANTALSDSLAQKLAAVQASNPTGSSSDDTSSSGGASPGSYFTPAAPLEGEYAQPYVASVDGGNTEEEIQSALDNLQFSWSSDVQFAATTVPDFDEANTLIAAAGSDEEANAIKSDLEAAVSASTDLSNQVDAKYQAEYQRLSGLLDAARNANSGSSSVDTSTDATSDIPAIESSSTPVNDIQF